MKSIKNLFAVLALSSLAAGLAFAGEKEEAKTPVTYEVTMTGVT